MLEPLSGFMGGRNRTMPWMVVMFGVLVVPLGVVSIVLVILQPLALGAWCTLCLVNWNSAATRPSLSRRRPCTPGRSWHESSRRWT
jgi:apolipoprotein N-acyltransferase